MSKIGIEISIDVTKINKARIIPHKNGGKYLTLTSFVDLDEEDQYGNSGFVTCKKTKEEGKDVKLPILGNVKVFWREEGQERRNDDKQSKQDYQPPDDDIPF